MTIDIDPAVVRDDLQAKGVKYALANFVDVHGTCKGKAVPISHLTSMAAGSELYTGAAVDGVPQAVSDDEVATIPDLSAGVVLPWNGDVAWFPSDLHLRGEPFTACSRGVLHRVVAEAAALGLAPMMGMETEFMVMRRAEDGTLHPVDAGDTLAKPCYDIPALLHNLEVVTELVESMNSLGWDVYSFDHEDANGQFETDFTYSDAVTMADRFVFFRLMAKEVCRRHGLEAVFLPKPFANRTGNGSHMNVSMASLATGDNLFATDDDPRGAGLSEVGYHFIGGVLRHAAAICAVVAPTVNSYKRLVRRGNDSGFTWAPVFACYGTNNRTNMLRIPMAGARVELRAADMSVNPYLGAAMLFAAGLEGIRDGVDPGEPHHENMYLYSDDELVKMGISYLPRTLLEAVEAFADDPLSRVVFGEDLFSSFIELKKQEWESYHTAISPWELAHYGRIY